MLKDVESIEFNMANRLREVYEILESLSKRILAVLQRVSLLHLASNEPRPRNAALPRSKKAQKESEIRKSPSGRLDCYTSALLNLHRVRAVARNGLVRGS